MHFTVRQQNYLFLDLTTDLSLFDIVWQIPNISEGPFSTFSMTLYFNIQKASQSTASTFLYFLLSVCNLGGFLREGRLSKKKIAFPVSIMFKNCDVFSYAMSNRDFNIDQHWPILIMIIFLRLSIYWRLVSRGMSWLRTRS